VACASAGYSGRIQKNFAERIGTPEQKPKHQKNMTEDELFEPRPWLEPDDIPAEGINVTIERVERHPFGRKQEIRNEVRFEELLKTLTLWRPVFTKIKELSGMPNTDTWPGFRLKLVRVTPVINGSEGKPYIALEPADPPKKKPTLKRRTPPAAPAPTVAGITEDEDGERIPF
jgi:hypothetical protein